MLTLRSGNDCSTSTMFVASVKDRRVVVTGASTGIGEQIAYHYAKFGARLLITARRGEVLEKVIPQKGNTYSTATIMLIFIDAERREITVCLALYRQNHHCGVPAGYFESLSTDASEFNPSMTPPTPSGVSAPLPDSSVGDGVFWKPRDD